jgi:hypothetical protein
MSGKHGSGPVVGLIQVDIGDTNIDGALNTFARSGVTHVIIVDANRGEPEYKQAKAIRESKLKFFYENSMEEAERRLAQPVCAGASYVFDVPPAFWCNSPGLVTRAQSSLPKWAQQAAYAPSYLTVSHTVVWPSFALLTHLFWSLFSLLNRSYVYRASFAVLRTIERQRGTATIAYSYAGHSKWRKHETAVVIPLPGLSPVYEVLYWLRRESLGWRRWVLIWIYVFFLQFPYVGIAYNQRTLTELFPVPLLLAWLVNGLIALMLAQHYFPNMPWPLLHAFALPLVMVPWLILCFYAKTLWRGYQGEAPRYDLAGAISEASLAWGLTPQNDAMPPAPTDDADASNDEDSDKDDDDVRGENKTTRRVEVE